MESPTVTLSSVKLVDRNSVIDFILVGLEGNSIVGPALALGFHILAKMEPLSSIGRRLIVMELMNTHISNDGDLKSYPIVSPSLAEVGVGGESESLSIALQYVISIDCLHHIRIYNNSCRPYT